MTLAIRADGFDGERRTIVKMPDLIGLNPVQSRESLAIEQIINGCCHCAVSPKTLGKCVSPQDVFRAIDLRKVPPLRVRLKP